MPPRENKETASKHQEFLASLKPETSVPMLTKLDDTRRVDLLDSFLNLGDSHGYGCYLSHNVGICRIANLADLPAGLWTGHEYQMAATIEFTPAANVTVTQLNKVNGPLGFVLPSARRLDFLLTGINLHK
jgi:hypothetical protein